MTTNAALAVSPNTQEIPASSVEATNLVASGVPEDSGVSPLMEQVPSVSQLSDVQPGDWAFQALQSLVERYGCIAGYPDQTFRGNRALTRYEFAAGLNTCLDRVNELIAAGTTGLATREDLETIRKLQEEFGEDIAELRGRIDSIEPRTATLESQQFSTTTKLVGEVIFTATGVFGDDKALDSDRWRRIEAATTPAARAARETTEYNAVGGRDVNDNVIAGDRVRLNLVTSFTGKDQLFTRLEANNLTAFGGGATGATGTNMTRLGWDGNQDNDILMGKLFYRFPVGSSTTLTVDAIGGEFYDNFNTVNPAFSSAPQGSISRFGRFSPIYRASNTSSASNTGSGVSVTHKFSDALIFSAGYLARRSSDPLEGRGLFDGTYGALAQLTYQPTKEMILGFAYAHSYFSGASNDVTVSGAYGSAFANSPFGAGFGNTTANPRGVATSANYYSLLASYRLSPSFTLSGWVNYTEAIAEDGEGLATVSRGDKADIWSWAVTLGLPDLGGKGNFGGIVVGMPPKVTDNDFGPAAAPSLARREDEDTSIHLEGFFRYQINPNISLTPGVIVIFNPEHNSNNDDILVGVLRTTFRF